MQQGRLFTWLSFGSAQPSKVAQFSVGANSLLYRLSVSPHAGNFVLKGALLFALWYDTPHRPTKDADLLGFGADDADTLRSTFTAICAIDADTAPRARGSRTAWSGSRRRRH